MARPAGDSSAFVPRTSTRPATARRQAASAKFAGDDRPGRGARRDLLVHFAVDAPPAKTAGIAAATGEHGLDEVPLIGHEGAWFCAAFEPRSGVRTGDQVEVRVDAQRLHFFDPETEESVRSV